MLLRPYLAHCYGLVLFAFGSSSLSAQFILEAPTYTLLPLPGSGVLLGPLENEYYGSLPFRRVDADGEVASYSSEPRASLFGGYVEGDVLVAGTAGDAFSDFVEERPVGLTLVDADSIRIERTERDELGLLGTNFLEGGIAPSGLQQVAAILYDEGAVLLDRQGAEVAQFELRGDAAEALEIRLVDVGRETTAPAIRYVAVDGDSVVLVERSLSGEIAREVELVGAYPGSATVGSRVYLYMESSFYVLPELTRSRYSDNVRPVLHAYLSHDGALVRRGDGALFEHLGAQTWRQVGEPTSCSPQVIVSKTEGYYAQFDDLITFGPDRVNTPPLSPHELSVEVLSTSAVLNEGASGPRGDVYDYVVIYAATLLNPRPDSTDSGAFRAGNFQANFATAADRQSLRSFPALGGGKAATVLDTVSFPVFFGSGAGPFPVRFGVSIDEVDGRLAANSCRTTVSAMTGQPTVGSRDFELPGLSLAPNPSGQVLDLQLEGGLGGIVAYDVQGRAVRTVQPGGAKAYRWRHALAPGVYVLRIVRRSDGATGVRRILVK